MEFVSKCSSTGFSIYPRHYFAKNKITEVLKRLKIDFHMFTEKGQRPRLYSVRGFHANMTEDEVLELLRKRDIDMKGVEWLTVKRMTTKYASNKGIASNVFKCKCISSKGCGEPCKPLLIDGMKIKVEVLKTSSAAVQCFNCQQIGHIT